MNFHHAIYTAATDISAAIPWGATPEKTQGLCIFAEAFEASIDSAVRVQFLVNGLHKTTNTAMAAALFIDDQQYAVRSVAVNPPAAGSFVPLQLEYCHIPGDGLPHTYRVHVGPLSGVMTINGTTGAPGFGATMAATLTLEEK